METPKKSTTKQKDWFMTAFDWTLRPVIFVILALVGVQLVSILLHMLWAKLFVAGVIVFYWLKGADSPKDWARINWGKIILWLVAFALIFSALAQRDGIEKHPISMLWLKEWF